MRSIDALRAQVSGWSLRAYDRLSGYVAEQIVNGIEWSVAKATEGADRGAAWLRAGLAAWRDGSAIAALRERLAVWPGMLVVDWLRGQFAAAVAACAAGWRRLVAAVRLRLPAGD